MSRLIRNYGLAGALVLLPAAAHAQVVTSQESVITTRGDAVMKVAPDRAWLTVTVDARDPNAAEARKRGAEVMTAVQASLKRAGVLADGIRTTGFALSPESEWTGGTSKFKGYIAHNQIEVRVDDLDHLSDVIDAANAQKGATLSISGPRFDLKKRDGLEHDVLRLAVESAMSRAAAIAAGARRSLGAIMRIDDQTQSGPMMPMETMRMTTASAKAGAETPITPGEIEIRAQVSVTVAIR